MKVILLTAVVFLTGCTIANNEFQEAIKKCEANDGLEWVSTEGAVMCNNGAYYRG